MTQPTTLQSIAHFRTVLLYCQRTVVTIYEYLSRSMQMEFYHFIICSAKRIAL